MALFNPDTLEGGVALTLITLGDRKITRGTQLTRDEILSWKNAQALHRQGKFKIFERNARKPVQETQSRETLQLNPKRR